MAHRTYRSLAFFLILLSPVITTAAAPSNLDDLLTGISNPRFVLASGGGASALIRLI